MSGGREQRKVKLMEEAERLIDELLDWTASTEKPNLSQIEDVVLELRQQFGEEMVREVVAAQEAKQPAVGPRCAKCGRAMSYKGQKEVGVQSWVGEVEIERGYYHRAPCQEGFSPLDDVNFRPQLSNPDLSGCYKRQLRSLLVFAQRGPPTAVAEFLHLGHTFSPMTKRRKRIPGKRKDTMDISFRAYPNNSKQVLGSTACGYSISVKPKI